MCCHHSDYTVGSCYLRRRRRLCFWFGLFVCLSVCLSVSLSVCLSVCPSDYSQTCERIFTKFFGEVGHGSRTKWYNFGTDPDHASDLGVQSPKSGSSGSAEVCALWVLLVDNTETVRRPSRVCFDLTLHPSSSSPTSTVYKPASPATLTTTSASLPVITSSSSAAVESRTRPVISSAPLAAAAAVAGSSTVTPTDAQPSSLQLPVNCSLLILRPVLYSQSHTGSAWPVHQPLPVLPYSAAN